MGYQAYWSLGLFKGIRVIRVISGYCCYQAYFRLLAILNLTQYDVFPTFVTRQKKDEPKNVMKDQKKQNETRMFESWVDIKVTR